ncbi:hypothetical protein H9P43_006311 [Blastocladiella emersonii ATCC 22665]|nr:hypothetical protein H9P43_006311 [Blastocladiella emersonii ATCC 22665]
MAGALGLIFAPSRVAMLLLAFFGVCFTVIAALALTRAPYHQLTQYHYIMYGGSVVSLALWVFLRARAIKSAPRARRVRLAAFFLAALVYFTVLLGLVIDQTFNTPMSSLADTRAFRLGSATADSAKIIVRDPTASSIKATYTAANGTKVEVSAPVKPDSDYVAILTLSGLKDVGASGLPIEVTNDKGQGFPSYLNGGNGGELATKFTVRTVPAADPRGDAAKYRIAYGSCTLPFPYRHAMTGYGNVYNTKPDLFLHLGDFIYADQPYVVGDSLENYRRLYRRNLRDASYMALAQTVPSMHIFDDHEVYDNWEFGMQQAPFPNAMQAYHEHVHDAMPGDPSKYYYNFTIGASLATVFMSNERAYRQPGTIKPTEFDATNDQPLEAADATFLGKDQLDAVKAWLVDSQARGVTWKILVSSVPFTTSYNDRDTWFGARRERQALLEFMDANKITNVHVLSGDRHEVGLFRIERPVSKAVLYDLSVSPIHAFYDDVDTVVVTDGLVFRAAGERTYVGALDVERDAMTLFVHNQKDEVIHSLKIPRV